MAADLRELIAKLPRYSVGAVEHHRFDGASYASTEQTPEPHGTYVRWDELVAALSSPDAEGPQVRLPDRFRRGHGPNRARPASLCDSWQCGCGAGEDNRFICPRGAAGLAADP